MFEQRQNHKLQWVLAPVVLMAVLAAGGQTFGGEGESKTYDAKTFVETNSIFGASFSHDETKLLITTDASGIFNVYSQSVKGGKPNQLTFSDYESIFGVSSFTNCCRFL